MQNFFTMSSKLLQGYKAMLKKQLSKEEYRERLKQLHLDHSLPRKSVALYQLLARIIELTPLAEQNPIEEPSRLRYSGGSQFFCDLKELLVQYRVEGEELIHASQEASSAMVAAIQLIVLPSVRRTTQTAEQLQACALKIARYGLKEQRQLLLNSLQSHLKQDEEFFSAMLECYEQYLHQHGKSEKKKTSLKKHALLTATV